MPIYIENARAYRSPGEYVGRPHSRFPPGSPLGNPYRIGSDGTREEVITRYRNLLRRAWRTGSPAKDELLRRMEPEGVRSVVVRDATGATRGLASTLGGERVVRVQ